MAKSGITANPELEAKFRALQADEKTAWIRVSIQETSFQFESLGVRAKDADAELQQIAALLPPRDPAYFLYKLTFGAAKGKWIIIFYCPDIAKVKDRMLYASSIAAVKKGFGDTYFANPDTYRISIQKECSLDALAKAREEVPERDIMTAEELMRSEAHQDSVGAMSDTKQKAIMGLPVKVKDGASDALLRLKGEKVATVILSLDPVSEELFVVKEGNMSMEDVSGLMDKENPRFVLHRFVHDKPDHGRASALVFLYYCPNTAKPKLKMFFSSCKAIVVQLIENLGLAVVKKLEASDPPEISSQATLEELYPKTENKKKFDKPKAVGGKARRPGPAKFTAGARPGEATSPDSAASPDAEADGDL